MSLALMIKLEKGGKLPSKKTNGAACYDCYACISKPKIIWGFQTKIIPLGFRTEFSDGYYMEMRGRSGNSVRGLKVDIGTIDSDYRGVVGAIVYNGSLLPKIVKPYDRISQFVMKEIVPHSLMMVDDLTETERGEGGFGSTGK